MAASGWRINNAPLIKPLPTQKLPRDATTLKIVTLVSAIAGFAFFAVSDLWYDAAPAETSAFAAAGMAICALLAACVLVIPSIKKFEEWERGVVLRFGRFRRIAGPGLCFLVPIADRVSQVVDIRIRVTDFSAQETLTLDSVTVTVDAVCFWLVWDPEKAVLELGDYEDAVVLSAKTALRSAVSGHNLTTFLESGGSIEKEIQDAVDKKTTEWGVTVQHIEITDIQIPQELQDAMSALAQAEREKKARVLLAEAEIEIAGKLEEAVKIYAGNDAAMKLKVLSILNEGLKAGNSMMLVPNSITEELKAGGVFGLEALNEVKKGKMEAKNDSSSVN
jgi:regulator of protease activity HflC (stomatin/prohibitin superfamily)